MIDRRFEGLKPSRFCLPFTSIFYRVFTRWIYEIDPEDLGIIPFSVPGYSHPSIQGLKITFIYNTEAYSQKDRKCTCCFMMPIFSGVLEYSTDWLMLILG